MSTQEKENLLPDLPGPFKTASQPKGYTKPHRHTGMPKPVATAALQPLVALQEAAGGTITEETLAAAGVGDVLPRA